jgi:hypothetical protein
MTKRKTLAPMLSVRSGNHMRKMNDESVEELRITDLECFGLSRYIRARFFFSRI